MAGAPCSAERKLLTDVTRERNYDRGPNLEMKIFGLGIPLYLLGSAFGILLMHRKPTLNLSATEFVEVLSVGRCLPLFRLDRLPINMGAL